MYPPSIQLLLRTLYNSFPVKMKIQNCLSKVSEQIMATSEVNQADIGKMIWNMSNLRIMNTIFFISKRFRPFDIFNIS